MDEGAEMLRQWKAAVTNDMGTKQKVKLLDDLFGIGLVKGAVEYVKLGGELIIDLSDAAYEDTGLEPDEIYSLVGQSVDKDVRIQELEAELNSLKMVFSKVIALIYETLGDERK